MISFFGISIAFLAVSLVLLSSAASAACRPKEFKGSWAFLLAGTVNQGNGTVTGIGALQLGDGGRITTGWAMIKEADVITNSSTMTGNYTVVEHCSLIVNIQTENGLIYSLQGVPNSKTTEIEFYVWKDKAYITGTLARINQPCTGAQLEGVWATAGIKWYRGDRGAVQSFSQTMVCSNPRKKKCTDIYIINTPDREYLDVEIDYAYNQRAPCGYFSFGFPSQYHIGVRSSAGIFMTEMQSQVDLATRYYRARD